MEQLPFPVGLSPFHAKGVNYRNFLAFVDEQVRGGREAFIAAVRDPALREFVSQPFLAASWYDALPMVPLCSEAAREAQRPPSHFARELAQFGVRRDAVGVYKLLLKLSSPESLLERSTNTARQYFDFVHSSCERVEPRHYRLRHVGVPMVAAPLYQSIVEGFIESGLTMAGAHDIVQRWDRVETSGSAHGVPIARLTRQVRWR
jgi:hypothetical protein